MRALLLLALLASPALAEGDAARGETAFGACQACHSVGDEENELGPHLKGVAGRRAGTGDYAYSPAMKASGLTWDDATLDRFLAAPQAVVPGTVMAFPGEADAKVRADIIAFLKSRH